MPQRTKRSRRRDSSLDGTGITCGSSLRPRVFSLVDAVATQRFYILFDVARGAMTRRMRAWSRSKDIWKRRSSIVCQLKRKADTDLELLYDCIEPSIGEKEFFLRKAIGWALREHAKTDPREVIRYVRRHKDRLSPLTKREAVRARPRRRSRRSERPAVPLVRRQRLGLRHRLRR